MLRLASLDLRCALGAGTGKASHSGLPLGGPILRRMARHMNSPLRMPIWLLGTDCDMRMLTASQPEAEPPVERPGIAGADIITDLAMAATSDVVARPTDPLQGSSCPRQQNKCTPHIATSRVAATPTHPRRPIGSESARRVPRIHSRSPATKLQPHFRNAPRQLRSRFDCSPRNEHTSSFLLSLHPVI